MQKQKKPVEFCSECPVDKNTGQRIYCTSCATKFKNKLCKAVQYAFGYISSTEADKETRGKSEEAQ